VAKARPILTYDPQFFRRAWVDGLDRSAEEFFDSPFERVNGWALHVAIQGAPKRERQALLEQVNVSTPQF